MNLVFLKITRSSHPHVRSVLNSAKFKNMILIPMAVCLRGHCVDVEVKTWLKEHNE